MTYNDYPILNDDEYYILQTEYNSNSFNRNENVYKIFLDLQKCLVLFYSTERNFNSIINQSLIQSKEIIQKILDNLTTLFNFKTSNTNFNSNQNIFTLVKQMINCSKQFVSWFQGDQKEYYKKFAHNCAIDLLYAVNVILNAMEQSF